MDLAGELFCFAMSKIFFFPFMIIANYIIYICFRYLNDVVIQHHDTIVTSSDLGLAVTCQYDLTNKTVANEVDLGIHGDIKTGISEEVIVDSPNVAMRITDRNGDDTIASAEVGDPLVNI